MRSRLEESWDASCLFIYSILLSLYGPHPEYCLDIPCFRDPRHLVLLEDRWMSGHELSGPERADPEAGSGTVGPTSFQGRVLQRLQDQQRQAPQAERRLRPEWQERLNLG